MPIYKHKVYCTLVYFSRTIQDYVWLIRISFTILRSRLYSSLVLNTIKLYALVRRIDLNGRCMRVHLQCKKLNFFSYCILQKNADTFGNELLFMQADKFLEMLVVGGAWLQRATRLEASLEAEARTAPQPHHASYRYMARTPFADSSVSVRNPKCLLQAMNTDSGSVSDFWLKYQI